MPGFQVGFWIVQGETSSLASIVLDPHENDSVLDVCAAPGGKTSHIASLTNNKAKITVIDVNSTRLNKIEENCERLEVKNIEIINEDASKAKLERLYDKVLIDAPCSNTGVMNKRPDSRWKKTAKDIENLSKLQLKILKNISQFIKPGGIIVYSTCSIEIEENQEVIKQFLATNSNFKMLDILEFQEFKQNTDDNYLAIKPFLHNMEGFFIARLVFTP